MKLERNNKLEKGRRNGRGERERRELNGCGEWGERQTKTNRR